MSFPQISKELLKERAKLHQKKSRRESGMVIIEGENLIEQLISNGIYPRELYLQEDRELSPILRSKDFSASKAFSLTSKDLKRLCDTPAPQGIAALYPVPEPQDISQISFRRAFYLDGISDPGNLGTIFRIAAAFGFDAVLLSPECVETASPKVIRASLGSVFWIPFTRLKPSELKKLSARKYALEMEASLSLQAYEPGSEAEIFIIGSEAHGLDKATKALTDQSLRIDMARGMESLNAAMAAGIVAYVVYCHGVMSNERSRM
ncbi:MAG TPA: RNA methyltransferase [Candidatus Cloacimonadota bacterium]|nr:RNA methyltransferase [Candidatus Cloacimonadota bacterium]